MKITLPVSRLSSPAVCDTPLQCYVCNSKESSDVHGNVAFGAVECCTYSWVLECRVGLPTYWVQSIRITDNLLILFQKVSLLE
jgi:hypothetical protein